MDLLWGTPFYLNLAQRLRCSQQGRGWIESQLERHYEGERPIGRKELTRGRSGSRQHERLLDIERLVVSGFEALEYSAAASLASATLDRPPQWPRRIEHAAQPQDRYVETWTELATRVRPRRSARLSSRHEPPSRGRPHSCAQAAPPLEPRRRRLSRSGHVIPLA
jgi:hypothetical protein